MLEISGIGKTYANGTVAIRDVTLAIKEGEIAAVVGGSGCGKSTLLRLLSGLDRPTQGFVQVDGAIITQPHPAVGIVFQEPRLLPWLSVADNVSFGLEGVPKKERKERIEAALLRVGLADYAKRWPRELSGGQGQRVAIARALVARPSVLLLDEPFSALDAFTRAELQDHLLELWEDTQPTLVLVTHDIEEAVVLASRIVVMSPHPGRVAAIQDVALPRPRDRLSPDFDEEKRRVLVALDASLARRPRQQAPRGALIAAQ
jgi:sulfonate transport system ATP-binding protein